MIKSFTCSGFRNISCELRDFKRINILIGPNNAGKSNFIRALSFAANMVSNPKSETTGFFTELKRNGWNQISNRYNGDKRFTLSWEFEPAPEMDLKYTLGANVGENREDNYIVNERLDSASPRDGYSQAYNYFECKKNVKSGEWTGYFSSAGFEKTGNNRLSAKVDKTESVILQMDNLFFLNMDFFSRPFVRDNIRKVLEVMRKYFSGFYSYSCTTFNLTGVRDFRDLQSDGRILEKDGSNFVNVFNSITNKDPEFKNRYLKMLKRMERKYEDIIINHIGSKMWMSLKMDGVPFSLSEVSDGTIHLLLLLMMLNLPEEDAFSLLAIDEPEMNLHPAWQKQLATEILRCKGFDQCFISTHSPDFLDEFTNNFLDESVAVFIFDPSKESLITKLNPEELSHDLKDWTLGDLYRIGDPVIGGWPQ